MNHNLRTPLIYLKLFRIKIPDFNSMYSDEQKMIEFTQ